ncbi:MAG: ATP-binding protein [Pseudomonadota bacterium]
MFGLRIPRLLRTVAFRYALVYALLFSTAVAGLGIFTYLSSFGAVAREADRALESEINSYRTIFLNRGLNDLRIAVAKQSQGLEDQFYLLVSPEGRVIAGNLTGVPEAAVGAEGAFEFVYERYIGEADERRAERRTARGVWARFPDAPRYAPAAALLIARDIGEREDLRARLRDSVIYASVATAVLGMIVGLVFSRSLLRKVDAINATAAEIRSGDLASRVATVGDGDELDRLAENINGMLDQIERLMTGMRQVSDNVAHDLRSPLTRIRSRLEGALSHPEAEMCDVVKDTIDDVDRMLGVFNALLAIARIESGEGGRDVENVDAPAALEELAELYEPAAREAGFALTVSAERGLTTRASRTLLSQAVSNLIDNALKYAEGGTRIILSVEKRGEGVLVAVADDGPGVPEAERKRIFDRFVRLESSRTSPGSGLGLSLVAAIARAYEARVEIEDGLGSGAQRGVKIGLVFRPGRVDRPRTQ